MPARCLHLGIQYSAAALGPDGWEDFYTCVFCDRRVKAKLVWDALRDCGLSGGYRHAMVLHVTRQIMDHPVVTEPA